MIGHRAGLLQPLQERGAGIGVHEALGIEGRDERGRRFRRIAQHQLQMRVGFERFGTGSLKGADIKAFAGRLEESGEGGGTIDHGSQSIATSGFDRSGACS